MPNSSNFVVPVHERQLLLDDHGVERIENLTRTLHPLSKKGAVIRPDWTRGSDMLQAHAAPFWDKEAGRFKFWLYEWPNELWSNKIDVAGYYESEDGLHWTRPILRQVEYRGSLENHFALGGTGYFVHDPLDPDPSCRFKGFRSEHDRIQPLASDGVVWRKLDVPPIPSWDDFKVTFDPVEKLFLAKLKDAGHAATYKGPKKKDATAHEKAKPGTGRFGRSAWLSTSKDFRHWTEPVLIFETDERDQEMVREVIRERLSNPLLQQPIRNEPKYYNADVYHMAIFRYEGLYLSLPSIYHAVGQSPMEPKNTVGFHLVQLIGSRDLYHWQRLGERQPVIGPSPLGSGAYDLLQILGPISPVVRGDELWFYYTGLKYRDRHPNEDPDRSAICLATLRRDGFISLDAGEGPGSILTQPFTLCGDALYVNVDAGRNGSLLVEVIDEKNKPVSASDPLTGDQLCGRVQWREGSLAALKGRPARLRFILQKASLYSYWLTD